MSLQPESPDGHRTPIGRRVFLGMLAAGAAVVAGGGLLLGRPIKYHDVSTMPFEGEEGFGQIVNPSFRGPERFRYYSVAPIPQFNRATWRLKVTGLVEREVVFTYADLYSAPSVIVRADFRCVTGWVVRQVAWRGIQLRHLFALAGVMPSATHVTFLSFDGLYRENYTLAQASSDHAIVAFQLNGAPLPTEQGAPARIIQPDLFGYKSIKWLSEIRLEPVRRQGYWEQKGWCNPVIGNGTVDDCG